jgi:hypothetical protein
MKRDSFLLALLVTVALTSPAAAYEARVNYILKCRGCHTMDGFSPVRGRIPPLIDVVGYFTILPDGRRYMANVPGVVNSALPDDETATLLNWMVEKYARASMPASFAPFDAAEIAKWRKERPDDPMRLRAKVQGELEAMGISLGTYP